MMGAAAILSSGYQAFFYIIDVLLFEGATFIHNLVRIGQEMRERHQFFEIQDGGNRHVGFLLPGDYQYHRCVVIHSRNIPTKFGGNW